MSLSLNLSKTNVRNCNIFQIIYETIKIEMNTCLRHANVNIVCCSDNETRVCVAIPPTSKECLE